MQVFQLRLLSATAVLAAVSAFALPAHAQDSRSEDRLRHFQMNMVDADKDGMVSRKEFMAMVSKVWDMQMADKPKAAGADAAKMKDKMTLEQYREFARMFGLDIGG